MCGSPVELYQTRGFHMQIVVLLLYACMSVGGLTCFKLGSQQALSLEISRSAFSMQISWLSVLGMLLYVGSFLVYLGLVARNQLGYIMPVTTAVVHVLTFAVSLLVFRETYSLPQLLGMALVFVGVALMNLK